MASGTGLRVIATSTGAGAPSGDAPAAGDGDFMALLGGAITGAKGRAEPVATAPRDAQLVGQDAGIAAVLAALFPSAAPQPQAPGQEAGELAADAVAAASGNAGVPEIIQQALQDADALADAAFEEQLAAALEVQPGELPLDAAVVDGPDMMQMLSRELLAMRDPASELRVPVDARGPAAGDALAATHALGAATTSSTTPTGATAEALRTTVGTPRWADELGSRLVMMSTRGQSEGSLSLAPEHLGPLEVRISVNQNTASVWFGAQHAETRAALAEALPRLREMFAEAGLSLGQTGVSHEAPRQQGAARQDGLGQGDGAGEDRPTDVPVTVRRAVSRLLDLYA